MGNNNSLLQKVYLYLPVVMCHSRMDYGNPVTMRTMRMAYFLEQAAVFLSTAYFVATIKRKKDERRILVPDVSSTQLVMNTIPKPEDLNYKRSTYFEHEMTQAFQQLQRTFFAFMLTVTVHFILGVRPILLLQLFSTPFNFVENRLFRKHVLGLQPGYRVWGERFDGEVDPSQIVEAEGEVATEGGDAVVVGTPVEAVDCAVLEVTAKVVQGEGREVTAAVAQADAEGLPMPKKLEDALIDAWDAAENADWSAVSAHVGPLSVNTQTPTGRWTPLMVACGLPKVSQDEIKALVSDLDARVDLQDEDGWTCAHWAAQHGRAESLRAVFEGLGELASDADAAVSAAEGLLAIRDNDGKTAAEIAEAADHEETVLREFMGVLNSLGREAEDEDMAALD